MKIKKIDKPKATLQSKCIIVQTSNRTDDNEIKWLIKKINDLFYKIKYGFYNFSHKIFN